MPQHVRETKHTVQDNGLQTISRVMQVLFALVQILLVFRLAFKLLGANASNVFVNLIYATTAPLVGLFEGIFADVNLQNNALAVFEPATVIAIIVTAAISYIILRMLSVKQDKKIEHIEVQEQADAVPLGHVSDAQLKQSTERPVTQASERPVAQTSETPVTQASERPVTQTSETPASQTTDRPVAQTSDTAVAQTRNSKLEDQSQELEERIRHQEQVLEHQRKTYGATHDENKSQELDERIRHQEQVLEDQREMYGNTREDNELEEDQDSSSHDIPVYKKRHRQI